MWLAAVALLVSLAATVGVWLYRRRLTRERFAFRTLSTLATLAATIIVLAIGGTTPWGVLSLAFADAIGVDYKARTPTTIDYLVVLALFGGLCATAGYIFRHWDGKVSTNQVALESSGIDSSLVAEAVRYATSIGLDAPELRVAEVLEPVRISTPSVHHAPWKEASIRLLELRYPSLPFEEAVWSDITSTWTVPDDSSDTLFRIAPIDIGDPMPSTGLTAVNDVPTDRGSRIRSITLLNSMEKSGSPANLEQGNVVLTRADLFDGLVDVRHYRRDIRRRYAGDPLPDSSLALADAFVEPDIRIVGNRPAGFRQSIGDWLEERSSRHIALLGDYGQGKSSAALAITHELLEEWEPGARLPVLIELRGKSPRNLTELDLLATWARQYSIDANALWQLHLSGQTLVIFDGFDEISLLGDTYARAMHFQSLWGFATPDSKIIFTGRPNYFFNYDEMNQLLALSDVPGNHPYCEQMLIRPFSAMHAAEALRNYPDGPREAIPRLMDENPTFSDLASRPSLLHMCAIIWPSIEYSLEGITSASVMKEFVQRSYRRQGAKQLAAPDFMVLNSREREFS